MVPFSESYLRFVEGRRFFLPPAATVAATQRLSKGSLSEMQFGISLQLTLNHTTGFRDNCLIPEAFSNPELILWQESVS